ncbi:MAG: SMP-30/gluconolactonase/LRE family protein [Thermomicrobiales bacterium]
MTARDAAEPHEQADPEPENVPKAAPLQSAVRVRSDLDAGRGSLDRRLDVSGAGWYGLLIVIGLVVALAMRFTQLNIYTMTQGEAQWAYDSWSLYLGHNLPNGGALPTVAPVFLLLQSLAFFLFGTTDAIARLVPAILGFGLVGITLLLRPFLSRFAVVGMLLLTAMSPTLVFASRTSEPIITVAFFSLLAFVAILRAGNVEAGAATKTWAIVVGFAIAATLGSGPEGVTALIALAVGLVVGVLSDSGKDDEARGAVARSLRKVLRDKGALTSGVVALVVTLIVLFSRGFSDIGALSGIAKTFTTWGRMMTTQSSTTPVQFFLYTSVLYEILAVVFAIVTVTAGRSAAARTTEGRRSELQPAAFAGWFIAALLLQSLASGRQPDQLTIVTLPLVLLGGLGLGYMLERIPWSRFLTTSVGVIPVAMLGIVIGVIAALVLVARSNDPAQSNLNFLDIALPIVFVILVVVAPLVFLLAGRISTRSELRNLGWSTMLVVAFLLGLYTTASSTALGFHRADSGLEPAAPGSSTSGLRAFVNQTKRLSRDLSASDVSNIDNTGSYGLKIAVSPDVQWPYVWYFRDFYQLEETTPAGWSGADMVIAPTAEGMEDAGFVVQSRNAFNRIPSSFEEMNTGTILSHIVNPGEWYQGIRFLLYRDIAAPPAPAQNSIGYTFRLSNQLNPNLGPFNLTDDVGAGSGLGQLNAPAGLALSPDGKTIYVVDSGNLRVQRYDIDGKFIGAWDGNTDPALAFATQFGQGPQGITTDANGLVYVADTWNHRIVVRDPQGTVVRELGQKGVITDTADSPDPNVDTGRFYGPRGVAVDNGEIYVVDTGNERVQVFAQDGTFLRTFGGTGTGDGKLMEPTGIAFGPDGNVWVADSGNGRLSVFTKAGAFVKEIPVEAWKNQVSNQSARINFLAFGPNGMLYATNPGSGEIEVFNPSNGQQIYASKGEGSQPLKSPIGIAVAPDGKVYVSDSGTIRVEWFTLDLPAVTNATPGASPAVTPPSVTNVATPVGERFSLEMCQGERGGEISRRLVRVIGRSSS